MIQVVQQLPPPHFRTLEYLTRHLARVAENNASTGMTAKNVAIVWAPNLLRCKELEFGGVAALQVFLKGKRRGTFLNLTLLHISLVRLCSTKHRAWACKR